MNGDQASFFEALATRKTWVMDYLSRDRRKALFVPADIHDAVFSYVLAGGKVLRPCVLFFSCGAVGGDEQSAIPAAVAVELFHTWTLVHDDIMDRDVLRRGQPTVHEAYRIRALERHGYTEQEARHYGISVAIMTGEVQHGWAISVLAELYDPLRNNAEVVLKLIQRLETDALLALVGGQTLDVQYSKAPIETHNEAAILEVLWRKTGALYQFAGMAGAMIGLNTTDIQHPLVQAVSTFTGDCGVAFQLQDDILGLVGDEASLGKPVGSDIREGKRTTILTHAFRCASSADRKLMVAVVGNPNASEQEVLEVRALLLAYDGVTHTRELAQQYISRAMESLVILPPSPYRNYLKQWADFMIGRSF